MDFSGKVAILSFLLGELLRESGAQLGDVRALDDLQCRLERICRDASVPLVVADLLAEVREVERLSLENVPRDCVQELGGFRREAESSVQQIDD